MSQSKGLTQQAKAWSAYIAKEVKTQEADNPNSLFLVGRTLLDKNGFNKINDNEHDVVHGVEVIYGPFKNRQEMHDFVSDYNQECWPGDNEWCYVKAGQPFILSGYYEPGNADVVHNKSLEFQGQLGYNVMQERVKEVEEVQKRLNKKEPDQMNEKEIELHLVWQEDRVKDAEKAVDKMKKHLAKLKAEHEKNVLKKQNDNQLETNNKEVEEKNENKK